MNFSQYRNSPVSEVNVHIFDGEKEQEELKVNNPMQRNDMSNLSITEMIEYERIMKLPRDLREINKIIWLSKKK